MRPRKYNIVDEYGRVIGTQKLLPKETLESMGYTTAEGKTTDDYAVLYKYFVEDTIVLPNGIKLVLFIVYRIDDFGNLEIIPILRIKTGDEELNLPFGTETLHRLYKAVKRLNYKATTYEQKARRMTSSKRIEFYESLPGETLEAIIAKRALPKSDSKTEADETATT